MNSPFSLHGRERSVWDDDLLVPDRSLTEQSSDKELFLILSDGEDEEMLNEEQTNTENVSGGDEEINEVLKGEESLTSDCEKNFEGNCKKKMEIEEGENLEVKRKKSFKMNNEKVHHENFLNVSSSRDKDGISIEMNKKNSFSVEKSACRNYSEFSMDSMNNCERVGKRLHSISNEMMNDYESKNKLRKSEDSDELESINGKHASKINASRGVSEKEGRPDKTESNEYVVETNLLVDCSSHYLTDQEDSIINNETQLSKIQCDNESILENKCDFNGHSIENSDYTVSNINSTEKISKLSPLTEESFKDDSSDWVSSASPSNEKSYESEKCYKRLHFKTKSCKNANGDNTILNISLSETGTSDKKCEENIEAVAEDVQSSNEKLLDSENTTNDRVEVKKVKLDLVLGEKSMDCHSIDANTFLTAEIPASDRLECSVNDPHLKKNFETGNSVLVETKLTETTPVQIITRSDYDNENKNQCKIDAKINGEMHSEDQDDKNIVKEKGKYMTVEEMKDLVIKKVCDIVYDDQAKIVNALLKKIEVLEKAAEKAKRRLAYFQNMVSNLTHEHRKELAKYGILPKVHTRTVGVNVRILQEHELPSNRMRASKECFSPGGTPTNPANCSPLSTNLQLAQATAKKCILPRVPPNVLCGPRLPAPNASTFTAVTNLGAQDRSKSSLPVQLVANTTPGIAGAATLLNKPRLQPAILGRQNNPKPSVNTPASTNIVLISTSNPVTTTSSINVIDLTEDGETTTTSSGGTPQSPAMMISPPVSKSITGSAANLVPVPLVSTLPSMVQLIPSGPQSNSTLSSGNTLRVGRPSTVLSQSLPQGSRVTYLVPQNSGTLAVMPRFDPPVTQIGSLSAHQPPFVSTSGQQIPTILFRMNPPSTHVSTVSTAKGTLSQPTSGNQSPSTMVIPCVKKHPAPLPAAPVYPENKNLKAFPSKPALKISKVSNGIVLSWNMSLFNTNADIATYQLFAYQESNGGTVNSSLWKKVGDVKALPLPMACTLTQFVEGHKYHFAVRAVDVHKRIGPFSDPSSIVLLPRTGRISK